MSITFSQAESEDLLTILQIWKEGLLSLYPDIEITLEQENLFRENFENGRFPYTFWVAKENNEIIGWQSYAPVFETPLKKGTAAESSTYIKKGHHKAGVAYELMKHALSELQNTNLDFIYGFVNKSNYSAIKLVNKIGFTEVGDIPVIHNLFLYNQEKKLFIYNLHTR